MLITGADLATSSGICTGRADSIPFVTVVRPPSKADDLASFGAFYLRFFQKMLDGMAAKALPDERLLINYESPTLPRARIDQHGNLVAPPTTVATIRRLGSMGVMLEGVADIHPRAFDVRECFISSVKKELTGNGRADKTEMVAAASRAGIALPPGNDAFDAADAFGCWLLAVRYHAPEHRAAWDRRLHAGHGQERLSATEARDLFPRSR